MLSAYMYFLFLINVAIVCLTLSNVENGVIIYSSSTAPWLHGTNATYQCDQGYVQNGGDDIRTCVGDGSNYIGYWNGTAPNCSVVDCGSPPSIFDGTFGTPSSTTFRGTVTYICTSGYILSGSAIISCLASGRWSTPPICTATCPNLTSLPNGAITYSPTSSPRLEGTTATHSCDNSYVLSGGTVRTCQSDRTWSGGSIVCQSITAEVIPPVNFPAAGQNYSLMCTVSGADSLYPTINHYQWVHTRSQVGTNSPTLTFDPLVLSDAGQYSCEVTISSSLLSRNITIVSKHYRLRFITLNIQLRFNGVRDCGQYTLIDPMLKTNDITTGLSNGINNLCSCGLNTSIITNAFLRCFNEDSPQHVTYRAILSETDLITTVELVSYIKQWATATQSLVVQSVQLGINSTCPVVITDFNSRECPQAIENRVIHPTTSPPASSSSGDNVSDSAVGGAIGGVLFVLLIAAAVVVVLVVVIKCRKTKSLNEQISTAKIEMQSVGTVPLGELSQPQPNKVATTILSDTIHQQVYETIATNHEYEDVKFREGVGYEQVGLSQTRPPEGGYDFIHCPAYLPNGVGEGKDPQS